MLHLKSVDTSASTTALTNIGGVSTISKTYNPDSGHKKQAISFQKTRKENKKQFMSFLEGDSLINDGLEN